MSSPAARVVGLTKSYGTGEARIVALDDVTLDIEAGEFTAVMGPSGSGKSTLMHCCAALDTADSGSVFIGDQDLTRLKDKALTRLRRDEVGFVFQSYNLVPTLTARENIVLPLAIAGRKPDQEWYDVKGVTANNVTNTPGISENESQPEPRRPADQVERPSSSGSGEPHFSREAIAEFQIVTNQFDITQGRSTGVQVQAISKSGTNNISGVGIRILPQRQVQRGRSRRPDRAPVQGPADRLRRRRACHQRQAPLFLRPTSTSGNRPRPS